MVQMVPTHYRDANKPPSPLDAQDGGDAAAAGRAIDETSEFDCMELAVGTGMCWPTAAKVRKGKDRFGLWHPGRDASHLNLDRSVGRTLATCAPHRFATYLSDLRVRKA